MQLKIQMLCTLQFSLILAPHSFLVRFLPERSLSLLFTFPMAVEQAPTQIGPSQPFFIFLLFYFSSCPQVVEEALTQIGPSQPFYRRES